ncbi:hypothetical protein [Streptomyces albicerus]|uniref:hypothetical protein n=1 Tax=Streptomyces albicerus TaxID=2569859 RepID=UPI00124B16CC|nr:hypothetical protein [Streptomyces albicerus]
MPKRPLNLKSLELARLRAAIATKDCPETRAAYLRGVAAHARREADRLDREADELLAIAA